MSMDDRHYRCPECGADDPAEHEPACPNHPAFDYIPKDSQIPALYKQESAGGNAIVHIKLFFPAGSATWYLTEYDPVEKIAFGWVTGLGTDELGYVSITELEELRVHGLRVERDLYWRPATLREVKAGERR